MPIRRSISTGSLGFYPLATASRVARDAGFDGIELHVCPETLLRSGKSLARAIASSGTPVFSVHPVYYPSGVPIGGSHAIDRAIALARDTGARIVVLHTPPSARLRGGGDAEFLRAIERWQGRLAAFGGALAVENPAQSRGPRVGRPLDCLPCLRAFARQHGLGVVLDTSHVATAKGCLLKTLEAVDGTLVNVHLSDATSELAPGRQTYLQALLCQHRLPGSGILPLTAFLSGLARRTDSCVVTLEVSPLELAPWSPRTARQRLADAVRYIRSALGSVP
jgi:sugar phosphate isomerase/epimerase